MKNVVLVQKLRITMTNGNATHISKFRKSDSPIQCLSTTRIYKVNPSHPQPVAFCNKLKIYQRNAARIHLKFLELSNLLINSDGDVLAIQDSKLQR